jgi:hypothetical protein
VVLPQAEQVKIATAENPLRAARETIEQPEMHRPTKLGTGWSLEQLLVECEKIPTSEINDWVLSPAGRTMSYEQRDQLTAAVRGAARRLAELAKSKSPTFAPTNLARWAGAVSARSAARARNIARNLAPSGRENLRLGAGRHGRRPELSCFQ